MIGFEDLEIIVERCPGRPSDRLWAWAVRRRADGFIHLCGRSRGSRAMACGDAALAVFRLLAARGGQAGDTRSDGGPMTTGT